MGGYASYNDTLQWNNSFGFGNNICASSSTSGSSDNYSSLEEYDKAQQKKINKGISDSINKPVFQVDENGELVVSKAIRKDLEEKNINGIEHDNKEARTNIGATLGFGGVIVGATRLNDFRIKSNKPVTDLFFKEIAQSAKGAELYIKAPTVMLEAQEELAKVHRDYLKQLKRYTNNGSSTTELTKAYNEITNKIKTAAQSGNADEVAKLTHQLKDTKGFWQRIKPWGIAPKIEDRVARMPTVDASKIKGNTGNSLFKNLGGGTGLKMGIVMGALTLAFDSKKIYNAFKEHGFRAGMTQLGQSTLTALVPATVFTLSDGLGKTLIKGLPKFGRWCAKQGSRKIIGNLCTKIATKLTGKAIGATLGSIFPGLGTIAGFAIGCGIADENNTAKKSTTELAYGIHQEKQNGVNIDEKFGDGTEKLYKRYCQAYCLEIDKQQAQLA